MTLRFMEPATGDPHPLCGQYVISYDPEYHLPDGEYDGGKLITTFERSEATDFEFAAALAVWKSGPTCECHRLRPDGGPNKPLRAFSVEISG